MTQATSVPEAGHPASAAPIGSSSTATTATKADLPLRILRIIQFVFAVVILGLTSSIVAAVRAEDQVCYDTGDGYYYDDYVCYKVAVPGWLSFSVFVAAFTTLTHLYLVPASWVLRLYQPIAALAIDGLSVLLWFAAFIVLAVFIGLLTGGEGDEGLISLQILEAATVFAALTWVTFILTLVYTIKRRKQVASAPSIATGPAPVMQQQQQYQPQYEQQPQQPPKYNSSEVASHPGQV